MVAIVVIIMTEGSVALRPRADFLCSFQTPPLLRDEQLCWQILPEAHLLSGWEPLAPGIQVLTHLGKRSGLHAGGGREWVHPSSGGHGQGDKGKAPYHRQEEAVPKIQVGKQDRPAHHGHGGHSAQ